MNKYLEKLKSVDLSRVFWKTKSCGSMDSPESGWTWHSEKRKKGFPLSTWILIALPLFTFLSVGIYFIVADVKMLKSAVEKGGHNPPQETPPPPQETTLPDLVVRFDYLDLSEEDVPPEVQSDSVLPPNETGNARETIIILKNDDSGKKIFLKTSARFPEDGVVTTPKTFVYSPTIPQSVPKKLNVDATTKTYNNSEDSNCFSTRIPFCEGILPYDVVRAPNLPGIADPSSILPYLEMIIESGCSRRAREFICSVLEPECQPEGVDERLPCKVNCRVFREDCKDILESLPVSNVFDCSRYPDWGDSPECLNLSRGECQEGEFRCSDGTCVPLKWVCDGVHDCPGSSSDEINCQECSDSEFRCILNGECIPLQWKCNGRIDCVDHSDETSC